MITYMERHDYLHEANRPILQAPAGIVNALANPADP
jgi:hypothetical protein